MNNTSGTQGQFNEEAATAMIHDTWEDLAGACLPDYQIPELTSTLPDTSPKPVIVLVFVIWAIGATLSQLFHGDVFVL